MQGLSLFGLIIVFAVTAAQIAGNNKREKEKFEKEQQAAEDLKNAHSEEIYEEDSKEYVHDHHASDQHNPFESH